MGFVEHLDEFENYAFGFLDPAQVIRAVHLIPAFHSGRREDLLQGPSIARKYQEDEDNKRLREQSDWAYFYVGM